MFSGIIEDLGTVVQITSGSEGETLRIRTDSLDLGETRVGDSIATNGVCLTVTDLNRQMNIFSADVSHETFNLTNLKYLQTGARVHLERALRLQDRINGHLVTGHVDGMGIIRQIIPGKLGTDYILEFPRELSPFIARKGSVAIDGISLTINDVSSDHTLRLTIIPHTQKATLITAWQSGTRVNLEADVVARYLSHLMHFPAEGDERAARRASENNGSNLTEENLRASGFI